MSRAGGDAAARAAPSRPDLLDGVVVKAWSDWFDVQTPAGRLLCQPRGRLRQRPRQQVRGRLTEAERALAQAVLVGDRVRVRPRADGEGAIEEVLPRQVALARPPVANVDRVLVVSAWDEPPWNPELVDRLLVLAGAEGCEAWVVLNKIDRLGPGDAAAADRALAPYAGAGYRVWRVSAVRGDGVADLRLALGEGVAVLAGPSGAGKSRLLQALAPERASEVATGEVSRRLGRGRHTTRHVELLPLAGGGYIADTPGFSRLDLTHIASAALGDLFPDIAALAPGCRFRGCLHRGEPDCAVAAALDPDRLARYRMLLAEIVAWEARRY